MLTIRYPGVAGSTTMAQIVESYLSQNAPQGTPVRQTITLGGESAEVIEGKFGESPVWSRQAFVLHTGILFQLTIAPVDAALPQAKPDVDLIWQKVQETF